jgi:hypothetical protein
MKGAKTRSDDQIFKAAKTKLGAMIEKAEEVADVVSLCNTLAKMKQVELESEQEDWGSGLSGAGS